MIEIRADQMNMFRERERTVFVQRVVRYLREAHARALADTTDAELDARVRRQAAVAEGYGIEMEAAVVQFIGFGLAFGEDFHHSWKYPEAERILASPLAGPAKAAALLEAARSGFGQKT